jgi:hypothetical protein
MLEDVDTLHNVITLVNLNIFGIELKPTDSIMLFANNNILTG